MQLRVLALAASLALSMALASCRSDPSPRGRVLLVGVDGATLRVARPLLDRGDLPTLGRIAAEGVFGPLQSHFPLTSPRIWASIATGKQPDKHGIRSFSREDDDGVRHLYESRDRKSHALWNIASDAGLVVGVVNWWTTYPLEVVNGVIVSDHLLPMELAGRRGLAKVTGDDTGAIVYPSEWNAPVAAALAASEPLTDVPDPFADPTAFPDWILPEKLSQRYRNDAAVVRIALEIERELRPDVTMVFLPGIDRVSHRLWCAIESPSAYSPVELPLTDAQRATMASALDQYYRYTDALIGLLAEGFGEDDLVMVVSDHGFEAGLRMMVLTGVHDTAAALHGVFFARGPGIERPSVQRVVSVNDVVPTILRWLGLPVGADMDGRPAPFLTTSPVASIPTYDNTRIEYLSDAPSGAEGEILDQLKSLGYFEAEEGD